jgi:hypothetical protein
MNIFKKERRITPQWTTTYPPDRNKVISKHVVDTNNTERITTPKPEYNNSATITGIKYTVLPHNRPTINEWLVGVKFSIDYDRIQYEQFKQRLIEKGEVYSIIKEYQRKNGIQPFKLSTSKKIYNFLNRHL